MDGVCRIPSIWEWVLEGEALLQKYLVKHLLDDLSLIWEAFFTNPFWGMEWAGTFGVNEVINWGLKY